MKTTKINKRNLVAAMIVTLSISATPAWAQTNYSAMTTEELAAKRGTMQNLTVEERNVFRTEWQQRVNNMSQEEQQKYMGKPANALRDGSGLNKGMGKGRKGSAAGGNRGGGRW